MTVATRSLFILVRGRGTFDHFSIVAKGVTSFLLPFLSNLVNSFPLNSISTRLSLVEIGVARKRHCSAKQAQYIFFVASLKYRLLYLYVLPCTRILLSVSIRNIAIQTSFDMFVLFSRTQTTC